MDSTPNYKTNLGARSPLDRISRGNSRPSASMDATPNNQTNLGSGSAVDSFPGCYVGTRGAVDPSP